MKSSKAELTAVAAAEQEAKKAVTKAKKPRETAAERKRREEMAKDLWHQTTKIVVPAWFGNCSVEEGLKLGETFTAAGLLALVSVGTNKGDASTNFGSCEVSMQMSLRPSGFDRQEARDLAAKGFHELRMHKLVKMVKKARPNFDYPQYQLSKKGQKWFDLLEKSAGCAKGADDE